MRTPRPLPESLSEHPFDRRAAADAGLAPGRLARRDVRRPFHGVQALRAPEGVHERCAASLVRMRPGQCFSHVTAAQLHGLPLPRALEQQTAVDVAAVHPAPAPATRDVVPHRLRRVPPVADLDGLPLCTAEETFCQLAAVLDLPDLVAVADALLARAGDDGPQQLAALGSAVAERGRYRSALLRAALALARPGSRSPQESRLRVLLVLAGIPEPELNAPVTGADGRELGLGDLVWRSARVLVEYEGDHHRADPEQWAYDIRRYEAFQAAGWTVLRVVSETLRPARLPRLVTRLRELLRLPA